MECKDLLNASEESIRSKQWNPYLGISINNKYFTPENIAQFTSWGADCCHDKFALLVVDILQRINNEVFDKSKTEKAVDKAFRQSDVILDSCRKAILSLPAASQEKVVILEWPDVMDNTYCRNTRIILENFKTNDAFKDYVTKSVSNNLGSIVNRLNEEKIMTLCKYVLYERSEFLCGFVHQGDPRHLRGLPRGQFSALISPSRGGNIPCW